MKPSDNLANTNMEKELEQQHKSPEIQLENKLESDNNSLQKQERKEKRPRIQKPVYSVKPD
jgi:hypothetical protein